jgi:ABC-2 type transport system ATP-binding protein
LLSSHLLVLVEALCDRVLILHRGQRMAFGSLEEIRGLATLHSEASLEDVFFAVTERSDDSAALAGIS